MSSTPSAAPRADIDPITFSVVWNKLQYLAEQVGEKVLYSTQSFVTALARDLGVGAEPGPRGADAVPEVAERRCGLFTEHGLGARRGRVTTRF